MVQTKVELILELKNRMKTALQKAREQVNQSTDEMKEKLKAFKKVGSEAFQSLADKCPLLDTALKTLVTPITAIVAGVSALGMAMTKSLSIALDWEKSMAKINVTAGLTKPQLQDLSKEIMNIGRKNVAPLEEVPEAFNKLISAGLNTKQSLMALDPTLKAAKAGFVDVATVATAGVNVMNSSGEDINRVYDVLFATLNKGAAEMSDIATYLPKIVPSAKQAGYSLGETAGAFAFLTAQGQKSEAATTLLQNSFKSLLDPAKVSKFKEIGVNIYDASGKAMPFISIIQQLSASLNGLTDKQRADKLATLGLDQEATTAFAIMIQNVGKLSEIIDGTVNSQGALNKAYKDSMTATDNWQIALNNVKFLMIKIGQLFIPIVRKVGEWAAAFTSWLIPALVSVKKFMSDWSPVIYGVAAAFALLNGNIIAATIWTGILAAKSVLLTAAQWLLNIAMTANPIGIIIVAIGALIGAIVALCRRYEGWTSVWNAVKVTLVNSFKQYVENWKFGFQELWSDIQIFWQRLKGFGEYVGLLFSNIGQSIKAALSGNFKEAKDILKQDIKTAADGEIERLKQEREANRSRYKQESTQRLKEVVDAWNNDEIVGTINLKGVFALQLFPSLLFSVSLVACHLRIVCMEQLVHGQLLHRCGKSCYQPKFCLFRQLFGYVLAVVVMHQYLIPTVQILFKPAFKAPCVAGETVVPLFRLCKLGGLLHASAVILLLAYAATCLPHHPAPFGEVVEDGGLVHVLPLFVFRQCCAFAVLVVVSEFRIEGHSLLLALYLRYG
ncbi:MAG TPA: phage tail tape measure protein [Paludibacteraceae bacterium]|nr:phage tail tape measure protein [Paludibacteraceae bacterium]HPH63294.1 phage tail tape measure protein [Paludibacteraceae bacterium]